MVRGWLEPGLTGLVRLGVPLDLDEPPAAQPVIPRLGHPAAGVGPQVQVAPPLCGTGRGWVRPGRGLAHVAELGRIPGPAPGTGQKNHRGPFWGVFPLSSVADRGRAFLADERAGRESPQAERGDYLGRLAGGDAIGHRLARHRARLESVGAPADID